MKYGLLGRKLGHSFSPQIHRMLGGYDYELIEKEPEQVGEFLKNSNFKGINVTIPYKKAVMEFCDNISEIATASNSVNTIIKKDDGSLFGTNTDYFGLKYLIESEGIEIEGKKCLVLGTGGVSGTVRKVLEDMGASQIVMISRNGENNYGNINKHFDADVIVNTTPVGMYPGNGESPIEISQFGRCTGVVDLIYNPLSTELVLEAGKRGIKAAGGIKMLVGQAAEGCRLFTGKDISEERIASAVKTLTANQRNIVLIGMPGSGKTSIGRKLAEMLNRNFIDIDDEIQRETGRFPSDIILSEGEEEFRRIETEVTSLVGKEVGRVIAAGGGIVERNENFNAVKQSGIVVYIKRDIDALPGDGRPISQKQGVRNVFKRRESAYKTWADLEINNMGIDETSARLVEILKLDK